MTIRLGAVITVVWLDPQSVTLGTSVAEQTPGVGDTIRGSILDPANPDGGTVHVAGKVTNREWTDGGIVLVTIDPE